MNQVIPYDERTFGLPVYDRMRNAIVEAYRVDEVADIRDKALAFEYYAKLAKDPQNERVACDIRLRAERKAGEMLAQMEKSGERTGHGGDRKSNSGAASLKLSDLGISYDQSSKWQQLAAVPQKDFEAALAGPDKPSTAGIIGGRKPKPMNESALWLWGRLRDFEAKVLREDPDFLIGEMSDGMRDDVLRIAPLVTSWLQRL